MAAKTKSELLALLDLSEKQGNEMGLNLADFLKALLDSVPNSASVTNIVYLTTAEYEALETKDENTLYLTPVEEA